MPSTRSRRLAAVAVAALIAVPVAGCGSGSGTKPAAKAETPSTSASPSSTASASATPTASAETTAFLAKVIEAMKAKKTAHMSLEFGSSFSAQAQVRYGARGSDTAMHMTMTTGAQTINLILLDGAIYLQQAAGSKYTKLDKTDPAIGSLLSQMSNLGPAGSLDAIKNGITAVTPDGSTTVGGEKVDRYRVTVNTAAATALLGGSAASGAVGSLPKTLTYTMLVDSQNLMRGIAFELNGQKFSMTVSDWGKPVSITAPPASQIAKK